MARKERAWREKCQLDASCESVKIHGQRQDSQNVGCAVYHFEKLDTPLWHAVSPTYLITLRQEQVHAQDIQHGTNLQP